MAGKDLRYTQIKMVVENEFLNEIIEPDTCCTPEEFERAEGFAIRVINRLMLLDKIKTEKQNGKR